MAAYGVGIPAFNAAATIVEILRSVAAQTVKPDEIIVVDDGSTDGTDAAAAASGVPVRLLRQDNAGPGSATTRGIAALASPMMATLDADDLWLPEKIARLESHPHTSAVFTCWRAFLDGQPEKIAAVRQAGCADDDADKAGSGRSGRTDSRSCPRQSGMVDWIARAREALRAARQWLAGGDRDQPTICKVQAGPAVAVILLANSGQLPWRLAGNPSNRFLSMAPPSGRRSANDGNPAAAILRLALAVPLDDRFIINYIDD